MKFVIGYWRMKMRAKMKMKMDQGKYSSQSQQLAAG